MSIDRPVRSAAPAEPAAAPSNHQHQSLPIGAIHPAATDDETAAIAAAIGVMLTRTHASVPDSTAASTSDGLTWRFSNRWWGDTRR